MTETKGCFKGRYIGTPGFIFRLGALAGGQPKPSSDERPPASALSATIAGSDRGLPVLSPRRVFLAFALFLLVISTALRVYHLGNRSLWWDEAATANMSRGTLTQMLDETRSRFASPVVYPTILWLVEKVAKGSAAVRVPSLLASLLAVVVMLAMVRAKVSYSAALFAAAILAVSASQIRYAQEVREYALAVLWGALLPYCLLRWEAAGFRSRHPIWLYVALFFAPLIQYGLVFLAFGVLSTIVLRLLLTRDTPFRLSHLVFGSAILSAGAMLAFVLALRYQFHPGKVYWYLEANYFDAKRSTLLHFLSTNTSGLLSFLIPEHIVRIGFVVGAVIFCIVRVFTRKCDTITLLVFTSVSITICVSIAGAYPYGGVRHCLFLAPVVALFAGVVFADPLQRLNLKPSLQAAAIVAFLVLICLSGYRDIRAQSPYKEIEDTRSILEQLKKSSAPNDQIWVNHAAVEAVEFYLQGKDHRFIYAKFHGDARQEYVPELTRSISRRTNRLWLVFSHLQQPSDLAEEKLIVSSLRSGWDVQSVITPTNAALFVANRKASAMPGTLQR
ncbi:MAG: hypothetical protein QOJ42_5385 [Acidobacteriaceae bacterium]|nr:hypothetical protein [Acidobacteriaceae bacterium]